MKNTNQRLGRSLLTLLSCAASCSVLLAVDPPTTAYVTLAGVNNDNSSVTFAAEHTGTTGANPAVYGNEYLVVEGSMQNYTSFFHPEEDRCSQSGLIKNGAVFCRTRWDFPP